MFAIKKKVGVVAVLSAVMFMFSLLFTFQAHAQGPVHDNPFAAQPLSINTFTVSPSSIYPGQSTRLSVNYTLGSGNDSVAICIYVPDSWGTNYQFSGATAGYTDGGNACPNVSGFNDQLYYRDDFAPFGGTFTFEVTLTVYASVGAGNYILGVRQYEGTGGCDNPGSGTCTSLGGQTGTQLIVNNKPTTAYADPSGSCGGNTPCYTSLTDPNTGALAAVAPGGTVRVYGDFSGSAVTISKNVTLEGTTGSKIGRVTVNSGVTAILRGNTIDGGGSTAITNDGTLTAYANNVINFGTTAIAGAGTTNAPHNWWGSYTSQPTGVSAGDWGKRLGAPVVSWGLGTLGNAKLEANAGSTGTGVIVNHGRTVPFDQGRLPYQGQVCSDYYDFFVVGGSGDWTVTVPVDNIGACDTPLTNIKMFVFATLDNSPDFATCANGPSPSPNAECWDSVVNRSGETITANFSNRLLIWSTASVAELGGTPIVAGTTGGADPTVVTLETFSGTVVSAANRLAAVVAGLLGLAVLALTVVTWRWGRSR